MNKLFSKQKTFFILLLIFNISCCTFLGRNSKKNGESEIWGKDPVVIRTDFSDDTAWKNLCSEIEKPDKKYGFKAYVDFINQDKYDKMSPDKLRNILSKDSTYEHLFFFVVDSMSINNDEKPILCIQKSRKTVKDRFRVLPNEMWVVESNLSTGNLLFEEFFNSVDADGVYRTEIEDKY